MSHMDSTRVGCGSNTIQIYSGGIIRHYGKDEGVGFWESGLAFSLRGLL